MYLHSQKKKGGGEYSHNNASLQGILGTDGESQQYALLRIQPVRERTPEKPAKNFSAS